MTLNQLWALIGADGFNGDTCQGVSQDFFQQATPLAIEPEVGLGEVPQLEVSGTQWQHVLPVCHITNTIGFWPLQWNVWSWGYWSPYPTIPAVSTFKWYLFSYFVIIGLATIKTRIVIPANIVNVTLFWSKRSLTITRWMKPMQVWVAPYGECVQQMESKQNWSNTNRFVWEVSVGLCCCMCCMFVFMLCSEWLRFHLYIMFVQSNFFYYSIL